MPRYWGGKLSRNQRYRCRECGKRDYGNYFITEALCKKCAAKRRTVKPNPTVTLDQNLVVTSAVQKRLEKTAEASVPLTRADKLSEVATKVGVPILWVSAYFIGRALFTEWSGMVTSRQVV